VGLPWVCMSVFGVFVWVWCFGVGVVCCWGVWCSLLTSVVFVVMFFSVRVSPLGRDVRGVAVGLFGAVGRCVSSADTSLSLVPVALLL
jgi:hypothetical protein